MSSLVSCSNLLVVQIEYDVYSMLRKVVYCSIYFSFVCLVFESLDEVLSLILTDKTAHKFINNYNY